MSENTLAVFFKSRNENFAVEISDVEKIIEYEKPKPIPESSNYLTGVVRYQERILPVIDINVRFYGKQEEDRQTSKFLVVNTASLKIGLLVDEVLGIYSVEQEDLEVPQSEIYGIAKKYMKGFIKKGKEITILLDPEQIFTDTQKEELANITQHQE